jgi:very-short-patch-repair endonuclease
LIEANEVVSAALEHARRNPNQTLGIIALSQPQCQLIDDLLEKELETHGELLPFFRNSSFFVKNLENAQGDESDVIFISIGYGKDAEHRLYAQMGPIIQAGGERRLNVLFTRAKDACHVFSNFTDEDMPPQTSRGWETLRKYLCFARTKKMLTTDIVTERPPQSPFEEDVIAFLQQQGYKCEPQVGSVGYFIDIGVYNPAKPGQFLFGIECDGAQYHSSRAARDRDRIRENVLARLGWKLYRIWSTHWFTAREKEGQRLLLFIKESTTASQKQATP